MRVPKANPCLSWLSLVGPAFPAAARDAGPSPGPLKGLTTQAPGAGCQTSLGHLPRPLHSSLLHLLSLQISPSLFHFLFSYLIFLPHFFSFSHFFLSLSLMFYLTISFCLVLTLFFLLSFSPTSLLLSPASFLLQSSACPSGAYHLSPLPQVLVLILQ